LTVVDVDLDRDGDGDLDALSVAQTILVSIATTPFGSKRVQTGHMGG
jgi:hypothetical protein